jgi:sulfatase maturation enzyme AslB (radical SAM superfamily)
MIPIRRTSDKAVIRRDLALVLTGRCNLSCDYCYQKLQRTGTVMAWATARSAIDAALADQPQEVTVGLTGGEPLLEPLLVRRVVSYLRSRCPSGTGIEITLTTNGTLLDWNMVTFLRDHNVNLQISIDGGPAVQRHRGSWTAPVLDRLLQRLHEHHPHYNRQRVRVAMALLGSTARELASSVSHLLAKGVSDIRISPRFTFDPDWCATSIKSLRDQIALVVGISRQHWERHGTVPVAFLRSRPKQNLPGAAGDLLCSAATGANLCVDPDGRVWPCPMLAGSLRKLPPLAQEAADTLYLGHIDDPGLATRRASLPRLARSLPLFTGRYDKKSSTHRCRECNWADECQLCPAAIAEIPENEDPSRVPDFFCAYTRLTSEARAKFQQETGGTCVPSVMERISNLINVRPRPTPS